MVACSFGSGILAALPTSIDGIAFDSVVVVDENFQSGHPADDVLAHLGKSRSDAEIVFRERAGGDLSVGGMAVDGVSGPDLLGAVVNNWKSSAVSNRSQTTIENHMVWLLDIRPNTSVAAYERGGVVYLVEASDRSLTDSAIKAMP